MHLAAPRRIRTGIHGVYEGPLPGPPLSASDTKLWAILAQLSPIVLGWIGPLVIFLLFKDRDRFVRFNAAEALNAAIAVLVAVAILTVGLTFISIVTFGLLSFLFVLLAVPAPLQAVCGIVGAIKVNERIWWSYPVNIRLVK